MNEKTIGLTEQEHKVSILVFGFDPYCALWPYFCENIKNYLQIDRSDCIFSTCFSDIQLDGFTTIPAKSNQFDIRLKSGLSHIKTEYVLVLLEDYFLYKPLPYDYLKKTAELMRKENASFCQIDNILLKPSKKRAQKLESIQIRKRKNARYRINLQPGIWLKSSLCNLANSFSLSTPWDFEVVCNEEKVSFVNSYQIKKITRFFLNVIDKKRISYFYSKVFKHKELPPIFPKQRPINAYYLIARAKIAALTPSKIRGIIKRICHKKQYFTKQ